MSDDEVVPRRYPRRPSRSGRDLAPPPGSLRDFLQRLPDTRRGQGRMYAKEAILTLAVCAMLCGARSGYAISSWIASSPPQIRGAVAWQPERVPSGPTIHRVLSSLQPVELDEILGRWLAYHHFALDEDDPVHHRRGVHGEQLSGVEIIDRLTASLHARLQTTDSWPDARLEMTPTAWRRFFGRLLYGSAMPVEATPAELQLRMAFLHTMGRSIL